MTQIRWNQSYIFTPSCAIFLRGIEKAASVSEGRFRFQIYFYGCGGAGGVGGVGGVAEPPPESTMMRAT